jgi:DNA-binding transcriptional regulator YiaG
MNTTTSPASPDLGDLARVRALVASGEAARVRRDSRIALAEIADVVGCHPRTIAAWEGGDQTPRGDIAVRYLRTIEHLAAAAG